MLKLFWADLKILVRNKQALFWSLMFPLIFTIIFGFFFGNDNYNAGKIALSDNSKSQIAENLKKSMEDSSLFKITEVENIEKGKDLMKKNEVVAMVLIPKGFGSFEPNAPTKITVITDPANNQSNTILLNFLDRYLTATNFKVQNAEPIFTVEQEQTSTNKLNYFDFILAGLIGMALMNSSIQGIAISMAKYREDKILKRITTTPLKTWKFVISEILSRLILNIFQVSLILAVGYFFFNAHIYGSLIILYFFVLIGAFLFQSIGFAIASVSKTTQAAEGMSISITIPMMFLAGVFFPIDQLPNWLYSIVKFLPLAPLLRMIRQIALDNISPFTDISNIIIIIVWIVIMLSASIYKFRLSDE